MENNNLNKFKSLVSEEKSGWLAKAKWRQENQDWLDISFAIAVKILATFRANKKTGTFPKSQKEFAEAMKCSSQYVNKLLKGAENLQLETITKIEDILNIKLIQVPEFDANISVEVPRYTPYIKTDILVPSAQNTTNYQKFSNVYTYPCAGESKLKLVA